MERSQLPLLRRKKGSKECVTKEKELSKKDTEKAPQVNAVQNKSLKDLREISPDNQKTLKPMPKRDLPLAVNADCVDAAPEEATRKAKTPVDLEWSKYMVKVGHQSDNYQKFIPEKYVASRQMQKCTAGLNSQKSQLPHQTGQHGHATKFNSMDGYSPSAFQNALRIFGSPGHSTAPSVFTFDQKHLDDPDSSPIYHELDPIDSYNPSANHTYQSITEIREEVERLQADSRGNKILEVQPRSGSVKSPIHVNSGSSLSSPQNWSAKGHLSRTLPSPLPKPVVPRSPNHVSPAHSPTVAPQSSRSQSIFSKLWLQKKHAHASKDIPSASAGRNGDATPTSPTARNLSLEAICVDVPKVSKANKTYSSVYAVTSPPPIIAAVFADYYQHFDSGRGRNGEAPRSQDLTDYYGLPSGRNNRSLCGSSTKRSVSESTSCQFSGPRGKTGNQTVTAAVENRLPWRNYRDLSPGGGKSHVDRWDIVRFGEPIDSHISGGGTVSLETFKSSGSKSSSSSRQNKTPMPSSSRHPAAGKVEGHGVTSPQLKMESSPAKKKTPHKVVPGHSLKGNNEAKDTERLQKKVPKSCLHKTQLSKSEENVLSSFSLDLLCASPPGSFESLLSEDDVFLPGSSERLNMLSPPSRTTFSSPSCGIRMAELRAVRRKSDSKSPSPEPPTSTPPPFLPFFQIPVPCHIETVVKQDVAVQTSPTRSPVRSGGVSSHRYMHTIIEEDHTDQGSGSDGKLVAGRDPKGEHLGKTTKPETRGRTNVKLSDTIRYNSDRSKWATEANEGRRAGTEESNLLQAISASVEDNSLENRTPGDIKLSFVSCSAGNDRNAEDGGSRALDVDALELSPSPRSMLCLKGSTSVNDDIVRILEMSPGRDCEEDTGSFSVGSETDSATPSPVSLHEAETTGGKQNSSELRSKTSKLRTPKRAKFFTTRFTAIANQCRNDTSDLPRYSALLSKARVSEIRPLAPPLKQFSDILPNDVTADATRSQPLIKHASVKPIDPIGTGSHVALDAGESKPSIQQAAEVPRPAPEVPLKSARNGAQHRHKNPAVQQGNRDPADQKKNISHLKSQFDPSSAAGSHDRIDTTGVTRSNGIPAQQQQLNADINESNHVSCTRSTGSSPSFPPKYDPVAATRHSSLSSSLTSSSSSVYSIADSDSESTAAMRPHRKDTFSCIGRPGNVKLPESGERTAAPNKTASNDGKSLERSRLAVPRISVSRCKENRDRVSSEGSTKQRTALTINNGCDDDETKVSSSSSLAASSE